MHSAHVLKLHMKLNLNIYIYYVWRGQGAGRGECSPRGQRHPWQLELKEMVRHPVRLLETEFGSSAREVHALNC